MAILDISSRLSGENQQIKIAEGLICEVDCSAETMLKVQELSKEGSNPEILFNMLELFLGKKALVDVRKLKLKMKDLKLVVLAVMSVVNEEDFEQFEKRFQGSNE